MERKSVLVLSLLTPAITLSLTHTVAPRGIMNLLIESGMPRCSTHSNVTGIVAALKT